MKIYVVNSLIYFIELSELNFHQAKSS